MSGSHKINTALVLLHGFCEDKTLWEYIVPELNFEGEIIAPNLPGFGNTVLKSTDFNLIDIATTIHDELMNAGIEKCMCIGHSLGGYITLALKYKFPDFTTCIGLIHSTAFSDSLEKKESRNKLIEFLDTHAAFNFLSTFASSLFAEENKQRLKPEIEKVIKMSSGLESKTIQAYTKSMRDREDYSTILFSEIQPLFIAGRSDNAIPMEDNQKQIAKIKNQDNCYLLENVAHMGIYESPSIIIEAINQFTTNNQTPNR